MSEHILAYNISCLWFCKTMFQVNPISKCVIAQWKSFVDYLRRAFAIQYVAFWSKVYI